MTAAIQASTCIDVREYVGKKMAAMMPDPALPRVVDIDDWVRPVPSKQAVAWG